PSQAALSHCSRRRLRLTSGEVRAGRGEHPAAAHDGQHGSRVVGEVAAEDAHRVAPGEPELGQAAAGGYRGGPQVGVADPAPAGRAHHRGPVGEAVAGLQQVGGIADLSGILHIRQVGAEHRGCEGPAAAPQQQVTDAKQFGLHILPVSGTGRLASLLRAPCGHNSVHYPWPCWCTFAAVRLYAQANKQFLQACSQASMASPLGRRPGRSRSASACWTRWRSSSALAARSTLSMAASACCATCLLAACRRCWPDVLNGVGRPSAEGGRDVLAKDVAKFGSAVIESVQAESHRPVADQPQSLRNRSHRRAEWFSVADFGCYAERPAIQCFLGARNTISTRAAGSTTGISIGGGGGDGGGGGCGFAELPASLELPPEALRPPLPLRPGLGAGIVRALCRESGKRQRLLGSFQSVRQPSAELPTHRAYAEVARSDEGRILKVILYCAIRARKIRRKFHLPKTESSVQTVLFRKRPKKKNKVRNLFTMNSAAPDAAAESQLWNFHLRIGCAATRAVRDRGVSPPALPDTPRNPKPKKVELRAAVYGGPAKRGGAAALSRINRTPLSEFFLSQKSARHPRTMSESAVQFPLRRVLLSDDVDPRCVAILADAGIDAQLKVGLAPDALIAELTSGGYEGLVVRSATKVNRQVLEAATALRVVGRAGTGVDNIDLNAASERGVLVLNAPGGNTVSAAEHACTLLLGLTRRVHLADASMRAGRWDRKKFLGTELHGKTLAVVGLGRIGREVANRMRAFGMRTIGYDPMVTPEQAKEFGVEWMELDKLWPEADAVTLHVPLLPHTENLVNARVLASCRRGVFIINAARGGLVQEADLLAALESGQCGGAGLDVFAVEPPQDARLLQHERVLTTPHLGASTIEAQSRVAVEIAEQFVRLARGEGVHGAVNGEGLAANPETAAWQLLAPGSSRSRRWPRRTERRPPAPAAPRPAALARLARPLQAAAAAGALATRGESRGLVGAVAAANKQGIDVDFEVAEAEVVKKGAAAPTTLEIDCPDRRPGWSVGGVGSGPALTRCCGRELSQPLVLDGTVALLQAGAAQLPPVQRLLAAARSADGSCVVCRLDGPAAVEGSQLCHGNAGRAPAAAVVASPDSPAAAGPQGDCRPGAFADDVFVVDDLLLVQRTAPPDGDGEVGRERQQGHRGQHQPGRGLPVQLEEQPVERVVLVEDVRVHRVVESGLRSADMGRNHRIGNHQLSQSEIINSASRKSSTQPVGNHQLSQWEIINSASGKSSTQPVGNHQLSQSEIIDSASRKSSTQPVGNHQLSQWEIINSASGKSSTQPVGNHQLSQWEVTRTHQQRVAEHGQQEAEHNDGVEEPGAHDQLGVDDNEETLDHQGAQRAQAEAGDARPADVVVEPEDGRVAVEADAAVPEGGEHPGEEAAPGQRLHSLADRVQAGLAVQAGAGQVLLEHAVHQDGHGRQEGVVRGQKERVVQTDEVEAVVQGVEKLRQGEGHILVEEVLHQHAEPVVEQVAVEQQQLAEVAEPAVVRIKRGRSALLAVEPDTHVSLLDHADVVGAIADGAGDQRPPAGVIGGEFDGGHGARLLERRAAAAENGRALVSQPQEAPTEVTVVVPVRQHLQRVALDHNAVVGNAGPGARGGRLGDGQGGVHRLPGAAADNAKAAHSESHVTGSQADVLGSFHLGQGSHLVTREDPDPDAGPPEVADALRHAGLQLVLHSRAAQQLQVFLDRVRGLRQLGLPIGEAGRGRLQLRSDLVGVHLRQPLPAHDQHAEALRAEVGDVLDGDFRAAADASGQHGGVGALSDEPEDAHGVGDHNRHPPASRLRPPTPTVSWLPVLPRKVTPSFRQPSSSAFSSAGVVNQAAAVARPLGPGRVAEGQVGEELLLRRPQLLLAVVAGQQGAALQRVLHAVDGAAAEGHDVLREGASLVAEQVVNDAELLNDFGRVGLRPVARVVVRHPVEHLEVVIDEHGAEELLHLDGDQHGDGDDVVHDNERVQRLLEVRALELLAGQEPGLADGVGAGNEQVARHQHAGEQQQQADQHQHEAVESGVHHRSLGPRPPGVKANLRLRAGVQRQAVGEVGVAEHRAAQQDIAGIHSEHSSPAFRSDLVASTAQKVFKLVSPSRLAVVTRHSPECCELDSSSRSHGKHSLRNTFTRSPTRSCSELTSWLSPSRTTQTRVAQQVLVALLHHGDQDDEGQGQDGGHLADGRVSGQLDDAGHQEIKVGQPADLLQQVQRQESDDVVARGGHGVVGVLLRLADAWLAVRTGQLEVEVVDVHRAELRARRLAQQLWLNQLPQVPLSIILAHQFRSASYWPTSSAQHHIGPSVPLSIILAHQFRSASYWPSSSSAQHHIGPPVPLSIILAPVPLSIILAHQFRSASYWPTSSAQHHIGPPVPLSIILPISSAQHHIAPPVPLSIILPISSAQHHIAHQFRSASYWPTSSAQHHIAHQFRSASYCPSVPLSIILAHQFRSASYCPSSSAQHHNFRSASLHQFRSASYCPPVPLSIILPTSSAQHHNCPISSAQHHNCPPVPLSIIIAPSVPLSITLKQENQRQSFCWHRGRMRTVRSRGGRLLAIAAIGARSCGGGGGGGGGGRALQTIR
uniref:D-3-phosphoglycerate dehydrogenase n=1 Tax=Macrostomum lignano TaxID=282301 RepID=A0A1I8IMH5_9PLAT